MARREPNTTKTLEVSVLFEPSRLSPACVAQAYEEVVPLTQRATSQAVHIDLARREKTMPPCRTEGRLMNSLQAALYARVSSAQQAEAHTVASQVVAVRERIAADGLLLPEALQFIDEGDSGATLVRPALERLRDVAAARAVDRLYVHSPDRLARKYASGPAG